MSPHASVFEESLRDFLKRGGYDVLLMAGSSAVDADMYYATGFLSRDPFFYVGKGDGETILVSQMEVGRAENESRVMNVYSTSDYMTSKPVNEGESRKASMVSMIFDVLNELGASTVAVPDNFPLYLGDGLRARGIDLVPSDLPFGYLRRHKSGFEVDCIVKAQRACEDAMNLAVDVLRRSSPKDGVLKLDDAVLTSESLRRMLAVRLAEHGCQQDDIIVACGSESADPHCIGYGPLRENEPIVIDISPYLCVERYYSDMTRTLSAGDCGSEVQDMYDAVLIAQTEAIAMISSGTPCRSIHDCVCDVFEEAGYDTIRSGSKVGFIHSTGHGVGLDIHEPPSISDNDDVLCEGDVVTIEPGLYYPEIGGVRLEDIMLVKPCGCENLTNFDKTMKV